MFRKKHKVNLEKIDNFIGKSMIIEGKIKTEGSVRIDGTIKGEIEAQGDIYVGETGKIHGDLVVNNLLIAGEIIGNVQSSGRLEISQTGRLDGDITTQTLVIAEGAQYRGQCLMSTSNQKREPVSPVVDLNKNTA